MGDAGVEAALIADICSWPAHAAPHSASITAPDKPKTCGFFIGLDVVDVRTLSRSFWHVNFRRMQRFRLLPPAPDRATERDHSPFCDRAGAISGNLIS